MNCSEGRLLMDSYRADCRLDDDQRRDLISHFSGCPDCRREGLAVDPTMLFLGALPLELERSEVASIRRTVHAMRRARNLEAAGSSPRSRMGRAAAAAILMGTLLLLPGSENRLEAPGADSQVASGRQPQSGWEELTRVSVWDSPSLIESLDRPRARVYQVTEQDLALVMIVDETLDL